MIGKSKHVSGSSGDKLGYMLGATLKKEQIAHVVGFNGFRLSQRQIEQIAAIPTNEEERALHKKEMWKIAKELSLVFDSRAAIADYRVNDPFEEYILSCSGEGNERERLRNPLTVEEKKKYGLNKDDDRNLENIITSEFMEEIGVHGNIQKKMRRIKDGKKHYVTVNEQRDAMFLIISHDGTRHPHFHALMARPDATGKVNDTRNEHRRIVRAVKQLSEKYGLALKLEGYEVDLEYTNMGYADKITAGRSIREALSKAATREEFKELLDAENITIQWLVHFENGEEYGVTFTYRDEKGKEHTYAGGQFDRSLTFGKIDATLQKNLAARQAQKEEAIRIAVQQELDRQKEQHKAEVTKENDMILGYSSIFSSMFKGEVNLISVRDKAYELMKDAKESGVVISKETSEKFNELRITWGKYFRLSHELKEARKASDAITAIGEMLMLFNPIMGLTVMFIAKIASDIRQAEIRAQKKQLLNKVEAIRSDISQLQEKKARLKIEKQERLQEYLDAKQMLKEYNKGLRDVDNEIKAIKNTIQPSVTDNSPDLIHITVKNAFDLVLPTGYIVFKQDGRLFLRTPNVAGQEISGKGIYLEQKRNGTWQMYPPGTYMPNKKRTMEGQKPAKGPGHGMHL